MNREFLLKYLTPMTWLLWAMIVVGMLDHFFLSPRGISILPQAVFDWFLIIMWPVLLAVWFGWKEKEKQKALKKQQDNTPDTP
jgi:hypothetical protein